MSERYTKPFRIMIPKMNIEKGIMTDKKLKDFLERKDPTHKGNTYEGEKNQD
jgi:hypothetical protein